MQLQKIILTNFKNYSSQKLDDLARLNCFVGLNGMGKTNLLDAIYYICLGKSYFGIPDHIVMQHETSFFRLEAQFQIGEKSEKIVAKVIPRKKKEFERNDVPYQKLSEHIGLLPVVIVAPNDINIVLEGSEIRRKFLDNTLSQIDNQYLNALITYNKILKQRNAALKGFAETHRYDPALIKVYDDQLLKPAEEIFKKRKAFLTEFSPILSQMHERISGAQEKVSCSYRSDLLEEPLESLFRKSAEKDRILQRTTKGPHKDDLILSIDNYPLKKFASQGQLKTFILALKLAQYEVLKQDRQVLPLLLLDDIFDKLDSQRVGKLLQLLIEGAFGQIFITDTHENRIEEIVKKFDVQYRKFIITHGAARLP